MADEKSKPKRLGAYAKLSATYYRDDAILAAGPDAEVLFTRCMAFSAEASSDGYITDRQMRIVVGAGLPKLQGRIDALIREGVLERPEGGYVLRSWLKWNRSAEEAGMVRKLDRERKRKAAGLHAVSDRIPDGKVAES